MIEQLLTYASVALAVGVLVTAVVVTLFTPNGLKAGAEFTSPENVFLLLSDYVLGALLLVVALNENARLALCFSLGALALTHLFRCAQKIIGMPRPFCVTTGSTLFNVSKAVVASTLWGICFALMSV